MADVVSVDDLGDEIVRMMQEYNEDVQAALPAAIRKNAEAARDELKSRSNVLTGDYAAGWSMKKNYAGLGERVTYTIYNKTDYQLTHLLEFGHANRDGGRAPAFPHIAPTAEVHGRNLLEDMQRIVVTGGKR